MNQYSKQNENKNKNTFFIVLAFILLSFGTAFGQTTLENDTQLNSTLTTNVSIETIAVKQDEAASSNSNMNFVLWFMGSKQDPNAKIVPTGNTTKKQFMTSGTAPNRLLIKAFLKKAVNFESAIV
jgi:hypothetical protein